MSQPGSSLCLMSLIDLRLVAAAPSVYALGALQPSPHGVSRRGGNSHSKPGALHVRPPCCHAVQRMAASHGARALRRLTLPERVLIAIAEGRTSTMQSWHSGELKVSGNMAVAQVGHTPVRKLNLFVYFDAISISPTPAIHSCMVAP